MRREALLKESDRERVGVFLDRERNDGAKVLRRVPRWGDEAARFL